MVSQKKILLLVLLVIGIVLIQPILAAETYTTSIYTAPTTVSATASPTEGTAPLTVQFKDTSKTYSMYCQWNFGDGASLKGNLHTVSHTYSKSGTYYVSLTIQDSNYKYITSQVATIVVTSPPGPKAGMILVTSCTPFSIQFKDNSTGNPTSWLWSFGDGTTSTLKDPTHIYTTQPTGPITINLTVSNQWGTDTTSQTIQPCIYAGGPKAGMILTPNCYSSFPFSIQCMDNSTGNPTSYSWNLGDGTTSTLKNPTYTYNSQPNGPIIISLTVSNQWGTDTASQTIPPCSGPIGNFTANPQTGCAPLIVCFTGPSSENILSWTWNFGDGTSSNEQNPCHTYNTPGNYQVSLTVSNAAGSATIIYGSITVMNCQIQDPIFVSGCPPFNVQLPVDISTGNPPVSWLWNFGDGSTTTAQNPVHTYGQCGNYTVTLTETYADGSGVIKTYPVVISCFCIRPIPTYTIRTWSTDGEFPAANVDVWYKEASIIPINPMATSSFTWVSDEHYLGKTDSTGVLPQVSLPDNWIVIRTQSPNYSNDCVNYGGNFHAVSGGWYYTANNIVNISDIYPKSCHDININLKNRYPWYYTTILTPTPTPTVTPTPAPTVTLTISPTVTITTQPTSYPWPWW